MLKFFKKNDKLRARHEIQQPNTDAILDRNSFIEFIITEIKKVTPGVEFQQLENDFLYKLTYRNLPEGCKVTMDLINVWNNYQRTGSLNTLREFVSAHLTGYKHFMNEALKGRTIDLEIVFPIIRGRENVKKIIEEGSAMYDDLSQEILMLYAENFADSISYVPQKLTEGYKPEQVKEKAFENLKKQGWCEPNEVVNQKAGNILLFINDKLPYQAQFFLKEMREKHLGRIIFISFPSRDFTVVFKPDIVQLNNKDILAENLDIVKNITVDLFMKQPGPTSHVIHKITSDGLFAMG
jgi:uncharacterized protein YtpQ (UPF0354 family)